MSDNTVVMLTRDGQRVNVPAAEARSRYNSGQFGFPRNEPIAVYDRFIRRQRTVSPEEIGQVINDRVDLLPTLEAGAVRDREAQAAAEAEQRRQMEQEYGDVGSMVGTVAENLIGGATFGGSHMITNALSNIPGLEALSREDRMRRAQINPALATGADITGAIAPSIAAIAATGGACRSSRWSRSSGSSRQNRRSCSSWQSSRCCGRCLGKRRSPVYSRRPANTVRPSPGKMQSRSSKKRSRRVLSARSPWSRHSGNRRACHRGGHRRRGSRSRSLHTPAR